MMVIIIMYLVFLCGPSVHIRTILCTSQLARRDWGAGGGRRQGICFISTDKLISRGGTQLLLDKRTKKELGAGGQSQAHLRLIARHKGIFPMQLIDSLCKEPMPWLSPLWAQSLGCRESHMTGWTVGGLLGPGVALHGARLSPLCDHLP